MPAAGFWKSKPPAGTPLDRSHPLAPYLRACWIFNEGAGVFVADAAGQNNGQRTGGGWAAGDRGTAVAFTGGTTESVKQSNAVGLPSATDPFAIECRVCMAGTTSLALTWGFGTDPTSVSTGNGRYFMMFGGTAPNNNVYFWGGSADWDTGIPWITDGQFHSYIFSKNSAEIVLYIDGVRRGSTTAPTLFFADSVVAAGDRHPSAAGTFTGRMDMGRLFAKHLNDAEAAGLVADPYAMFAPPIWRRYFIPPAGAGGVTGTGAITIGAPVLAGAGTFTTTGTGAISIGAPVLAGTGSFATTGTGALSIGAPVIAGTGSFATTGSGAISIGIPVLAGTGTVTGPPGSGSITIAPPVLAGSGTFTTTGTGAITIGGPAVAGSGTVADPGTGSGAISIGPPQVAGTGSFATTGAGAVSISPPVLAGAGTFVGPASGTGVITIPAPVLAGTGTLIYTGTGTITIPRPMLLGYEAALVIATRATASDAAYSGAVAGDLALVGATASDSEV
jgi:hypothetical protein